MDLVAFVTQGLQQLQRSQVSVPTILMGAWHKVTGFIDNNSTSVVGVFSPVPALVINDTTASALVIYVC